MSTTNALILLVKVKIFFDNIAPRYSIFLKITGNQDKAIFGKNTIHLSELAGRESLKSVMDIFYGILHEQTALIKTSLGFPF